MNTQLAACAICVARSHPNGFIYLAVVLLSLSAALALFWVWSDKR